MPQAGPPRGSLIPQAYCRYRRTPQRSLLYRRNSSAPPDFRRGERFCQTRGVERIHGNGRCWPTPGHCRGLLLRSTDPKGQGFLQLQVFLIEFLERSRKTDWVVPVSIQRVKIPRFAKRRAPPSCGIVSRSAWIPSLFDRVWLLCEGLCERRGRPPSPPRRSEFHDRTRGRGAFLLEVRGKVFPVGRPGERSRPANERTRNNSPTANSPTHTSARVVLQISYNRGSGTTSSCAAI